jgi:tetratricopeptide (TPR) repeat protein
LVNLTGEADRQDLVKNLTDRLVAELFRRCRGSLFVWVADERRWNDALPTRNSSGINYVLYGSVQRGGHGMLRVNLRISDALTADYLWAGRQEFPPEDLAVIQAEITRQISRVLHGLVLHEASRQAVIGLDADLRVDECLARAETARKAAACAELSAEAQRWFLAALARDPHNIEALVGLAGTCQYLVSNPWWGDPQAVAAASDLGREAIEVALELAPKHPFAKFIQGQLYSAAGQLEEADHVFLQALAIDDALAIAHGYAGYNAALLGRAWETSPAVERAMRLDATERRHSIFLFYAGFAELLLGRTEAAIGLLRKSLERNPSCGSTQLSLMAALSLIGQHSQALSTAETFRRQHPDYPARSFRRVWLSRSTSPVYRAQIHPLFESMSTL